MSNYEASLKQVAYEWRHPVAEARSGNYKPLFYIIISTGMILLGLYSM